MTKTTVVTTDGQVSKAPFLRGILTHSLQSAGLSFDEAYAVASSVREELSDTAEITVEHLRERVIRILSDHHGEAVLQRYQAPAPATLTILVRHLSGAATAFSREQLRRHVESSGLSYEDAADVTLKLFNHLVKRGLQEITSSHLGMLTYRYLSRVKGPKAAMRYLVMVDHLRGRRPLLLLIGGTTGSGKSAVARELALRLGIERTQSTDLLREVMRMMLPERLLPVLHASSFNAWWALPGKNETAEAPEAMLAAGFRAQSELLSVACEAVIRRSLTESTSLILEGVHVEPSLLAKIPKDRDAVIVPLVLAVLDHAKLRERITRRGDLCDLRGADRYLENFEAIRDLQAFLLSEADRWGLPIIRNDDMDRTVRDCMKLILDHLSRRFERTAREVFSTRPD